MKRGGARLLEKGVEVALLTAQRGPDRQKPLHEATAFGAVTAEASLAHEHGEADGALGGVVGGLDAVDVDKGEERGLQLEDRAAHPTDLAAGQTCAFFEQRQELAPHGLTGELKLRPRHGAVANAVPQ